MTAASPGPAPVTPGRAAHAAYIAHLRPGAPETADYEGAWEAAAQAAIAHPSSHDGCTAQIAGLETDRAAARRERDEARAVAAEFRKQLETAVREGDQLRERLAMLLADTPFEFRPGWADEYLSDCTCASWGEEDS